MPSIILATLYIPAIILFGVIVFSKVNYQWIMDKAYYLQIIFYLFVVLGFVLVTLWNIYSYFKSSHSFRIKNPEVKSREDIWQRFLDQSLVYSYRTWWGVLRCEKPLPLEKIYENILSCNSLIKKEHIQKFLFNPDYSDPEFASLIEKIRKCHKDSRSWESKRCYSLEEYLKSIVTLFVFSRINKVLLIKDNEDFNKFLETGKIT